ncbi:MAG TPA: GatB/YqeY domain-containing protein [Methylomirabilota bacterium]|jgi:uncharacterized protein YqeY|nr:GatB/YqeY domain-containing protein [Methylomirabilota bacterium]
MEQIDADLKTALKEKNEVALSALRNLKAALKNAEIEKKSALTADDVLKVIAKKVKQHKDSITGFQAGNRSDLVEHEKLQMQVLEKYLPEQMDEAEVLKVVQDTISEMNASVADFGKVMKAVVAKISGGADGAVVSKLVKENLK